eukprot:scaffold77210_cov18-Tisochrysis_lutea.AAC.3
MAGLGLQTMADETEQSSMDTVNLTKWHASEPHNSCQNPQKHEDKRTMNGSVLVLQGAKPERPQSSNPGDSQENVIN